MMKTIFFNFSLALCACLMTLQTTLTYAQQDALDELLRNSEHLARLSAMSVSSPMGRLLLARKDDVLCAVQFLEAKRANDKRAPSIFSSGEENLSAQYRWFLLEATPQGTVRALKSGDGIASTGPSVGIGRFATIFGRESISCGHLQVLWAYPNRLVFITEGGDQNSSQYDDKLELSPTAATRVEEIDLRKVTWYRLDEKRKTRVIPLSELQ